MKRDFAVAISLTLVAMLLGLELGAVGFIVRSPETATTCDGLSAQMDSGVPVCGKGCKWNI